MEILAIFAGIFAIIGVIYLIRNLVNAGRVAKAKKLAAAGQRGQALEMFLKPLQFGLGSAGGPPILDHVLELYRGAGFGASEVGKIRDKYMQLHEELKSDISDLNNKKLKSKQKTDATIQLSKDYIERFKKEFVPSLPKLN